MRKLCALALVVAACGTDVNTRGDNDGQDGGGDGSGSGSGTTGDELDGAALFADTCSQCHGADGKGTQDGPQILNPTIGYATYVVRRGRNEMGYPAPMKAFDTTVLRDNELTAILEWLSSAPKPTTGAELYGRFCQNCHGANGRTGRVGTNIVMQVARLNMMVRSGSGGTNYGNRTDYMPAFSAERLTDAEVALIKAHVSSL